MAEIEGFEGIISTLTLAKALHDIDRFNIVEERFLDELCWDGYYHNMLEATAAIFSGFENDYNENSDDEIMCFTDEVISNYFVHAWEYGKRHNLHYSQNPYVSLAKEETEKWLHVSTCSYWKLSAYIRSKKSAKKSRIFVYIDTCCGCNAHENIAYGLVQLYAWFVNKNAEFEAMKTAAEEAATPVMPAINMETEYRGVCAA